MNWYPYSMLIDGAGYKDQDHPNWGLLLIRIVPPSRIYIDKYSLVFAPVQLYQPIRNEAITASSINSWEGLVRRLTSMVMKNQFVSFVNLISSKMAFLSYSSPGLLLIPTVFHTNPSSPLRTHPLLSRQTLRSNSSSFLSCLEHDPNPSFPSKKPVPPLPSNPTL